MQRIMELTWGDSGRIPLIVGAILLYSAGQLLIVARGGVARPGGMAFFYFISIALVAIVETVRGHSGLALAIVLGTSVGCLSLIQGSVILVAPGSEAPANLRRLWPFVVPATLLVFMAGFAGVLTRAHAGIFLVEGLALLMAWNGRGDPSVDRAISAMEGKSLNLWLLGIAGVVSIGGSLVALWGARQISEPYPMPAADLVVPAILGPILIIPAWVAEISHAHVHKQPAVATTTAVGIVLLNLCLLLPVMVLISVWKGQGPMIYSILSWRVDTVVLLVFGFILLPPALGRWRLGVAEGITLVGLYVVYVLMGIIVSTKT
jgi:Ca2+/Na+ antiporter